MDLTQELVESYYIRKGQQEIFDMNFPHNGSFGLRASSGGKKSYFYLYNLDGSRRRITIGQHPTITLEEAKIEAGKFAYQVSIGKDPKLERKVIGKARNISNLAKWFFESNQDLSLITTKEYRRIFSKEIEPVFGTRSPSSLENKEITALIRRIGNERGKKTQANRTRALLHRIYAFGIEHGLLVNNPVEDTLGFIVPDKPRKFLDLAQIKKLWTYLDEVNVSVGAMFRLLILTAQGPKRLQGLNWSDLRLEQLYYPELRSLPLQLPSSAIQIIKSLRFPNGKHEKVFGDFGNQHYSTMQRHFKLICEDAKLEMPCSIINLRKSVEFQLRKLGINHYVISYIMQKKTEVERLKGLKALNFESEAKLALERWAKLVITNNPKPITTKVIQLFPKNN